MPIRSMPSLVLPLTLAGLLGGACDKTGGGASASTGASVTPPSPALVDSPVGHGPPAAPSDKGQAPAAPKDDHHAAPAAYACPMHPEVTSAAPAKCSKCGMDLVSTEPAAPPTVKVTSVPVAPKAGETARLQFEIIDGGTRLVGFDVVHDKKLHLLLVTPDLAWFAHEHPEPQPDGTFVLDFTFPHGGPFRLFADFKASGRAPAVVPVDVTVAGQAPAPQKLVPSDLSKARRVGAYAVRMTTPPPAAGETATLKFLVVRDGKPVTDLSPYLGALGHLVIVNEDGKTFLHSHPEETGPHDDSGQAPHTHTAVAPGEVAFGTRFPKAGLYKAWGQFLHQGNMIIADFVVEIR